MKVIIGVVSRALSSFLNVALLLFLFLFIYSLLGCQIYAGQLSYDNEIGLRSTYDTFSRAFITSFQILTMENWQQVFYVALSSDVNKIITIIYMISWIFIGNLSLLNLFLAILLDGFTNDDAEADAKEMEKELEKMDNEDETSETASITTTNMLGQDQSSFRYSKINQKKEEKKQQKDIKKLLHKNFEDPSQQIDSDIEDIEKQLEDDDKVKEDQKREEFYQSLQCQKSIFIFRKSNFIRKYSFRLVQHPIFDKIILILIVLSSLKLAFDTYLPNETQDQNKMVQFSKTCDIIFNILFLIEAVLKIISFGFIVEEDTYFRDIWNKIDFVIVVTSMLDMSVEGINIPAIKILRMLRTLRPLRFVSHNVNIKIVVIALFQSMGAILNVLIVVFLVYLMFGILGMSLLSGKMHYCDLESPEGISKEDCKFLNVEWKNINTNFDNIGSSLVTLYAIGTLEGWPDMMYAAVDATDVDQGPQKNHNLPISLFFIGFILVGSFFFLNLFVGAICFNFDQAHKNEKSCMYSFLTDEQRNWIEMQKMILRAKPDFSKFYVPTNKQRLKVFYFINSKVFEIGIMVCIILNIITMALNYEGMSSTLNNVLEITNYFFTSVFMIECSLKIFALGWKGYWIVSWNKFDFVVVLTSLLDIFMSILLSGGGSSFLRVGPQLARVVRVLRVSRLLKLSKNLEGLQKILDTMVLSFPSMMNIGALTMLVLYIYSILGCFLFSDVTSGEMIDHNSNFKTFHNSIITLFRCATGEDWFVIMFDVSKTTDCIQNETCGSNFIFLIFTIGFAIPYFITFILIGRFIMLNLFILVILNDFEEYHLKSDNPVEKFQNNLESFMSIWEKYTFETKGVKIKQNKIVNFFSELLPPLGFKGSNKSKQQIAAELMKLNIPNIEDYIYFNDLLFSSMKRAYGEKMAKATSKELLAYMALEENETKKRLRQQKKKELTQTGKSYKKMNTQEFQNLVKHTNPVVQSIFVRMSFLIWKRYSKLLNELRKEDDSNDIRDKISIATEYEDVTSSSSSSSSNSDNDQESDEDVQQTKIHKNNLQVKQEVSQFNPLIQELVSPYNQIRSVSLLNQQSQLVTPTNYLITGKDRFQMNLLSSNVSTRQFMNQEEKIVKLNRIPLNEIDNSRVEINNTQNDQSNLDNSQLRLNYGLNFNQQNNLYNQTQSQLDISQGIPQHKKIIDFEDLEASNTTDFSPIKIRSKYFDDNKSKIPSSQIILQNNESSSNNL